MEAHFEDRVGRATAPLLAKMDAIKDSLSAEIRAYATIKSESDKAKELRVQRMHWVVATAIAVAGFMVALGKVTGHL